MSLGISQPGFLLAGIAGWAFRGFQGTVTGMWGADLYQHNNMALPSHIHHVVLMGPVLIGLWINILSLGGFNQKEVKQDTRGNPFLADDFWKMSCLSNAFLNDLHFLISISNAIRYEGIVLPIEIVVNLKSRILRREGHKQLIHC